MNNNKQIGEIIKTSREARGLNQEELAKLCGWKSRAIICQIEKGVSNLTREKCIIISKVLGISVNYLLGIEKMKATPASYEFLPYLEAADEKTLEHVRLLLGMPKKRIKEEQPEQKAQSENNADPKN